MLYTALERNMHRTQVYFEEEVLEALREEAKRKKTTLAAVIREKVKKEIKIKPKKRVSIMHLYGSLKPKVKFKKTDDIYKIMKIEEQAWPNAAAEHERRLLRRLAKKK